MRSTGIALCAAGLAALCGPVSADDLRDRLAAHGFVSQAYLNSEKNEYLVPGSKKGSFELRDAALNVNVALTPKLHVGLQFLSRDFGVEGNGQAKLDWGFGDYRLKDWLGVRVGKVKAPLGLYNETRDADFLRPMAFLPTGVYDEITRDLSNAVGGGGVYGSVQLHSAGELSYQVVGGNIGVDPGSALVTMNLAKINAVLTAMRLPSATDASFESNNVIVGQVIYEPPLKGLRIGVSAANMGGVFHLTAHGVPLGTVSAEFKDLVVVSAEYARGGLVLATEYKTSRFRTDIAGRPQDDPEGWYALANWTVPGGRGLQLNAVYDVFHRNRDSAKRKAYRVVGKRKSLGFGVRCDFTRNFVGKAEWHTVDGAASLAEYIEFLNSPSAPAEHWSYFVVKATFVF